MLTGLIKIACPLLLAALSVGCSHPRVSPRDLGPLPPIDGQARSLSLTSQIVQANQLLPPGHDAWYARRNDAGPSVSAGVRTTRFERSVTYTRDQQSIFNGRVHDNYRQTTFRRTVTESAR